MPHNCNSGDFHSWTHKWKVKLGCLLEAFLSNTAISPNGQVSSTAFFEYVSDGRSFSCGITHHKTTVNAKCQRPRRKISKENLAIPRTGHFSYKTVSRSLRISDSIISWWGLPPNRHGSFLYQSFRNLFRNAAKFGGYWTDIICKVEQKTWLLPGKIQLTFSLRLTSQSIFKKVWFL